MKYNSLRIGFLIALCLVTAAFTEVKGDNNPAIVRIGVDVGGTNTDAVLLHGSKIIDTTKTTTTPDVTQGVVTAVKKLMRKNKTICAQAQYVMIGTTHLLNDLLQGKIDRVLAIRLGSPATTAVPPLINWPESLRQSAYGISKIAQGGYELDGRKIAALNKKELTDLAFEAQRKGITSVAITGVFAHTNAQQEIEAAKVLKQIDPNFTCSLSYKLGGLGLLARENAAVLNASLTTSYKNLYQAIKGALEELNLDARLYLTNSTGTIQPFDDDESQNSAVLTLNSGPTNSIRGGGVLADVSEAVVVDIGGTSTDVGLLHNKFPKLVRSPFSLAGTGITCNFSSPLIEAIGLGGGSIITVKEDKITVGPQSVGLQLKQKALVFGGKTLTVTDVAVAQGRISLGNKALVLKKYSQKTIDQLDAHVHSKLARVINNVLASVKDHPKRLVLVGGGSVLIDSHKLKGLLKSNISIKIPSGAEVANAVGAAIAQVEGRHFAVYKYATIKRSEAIAEATLLAKNEAIAKGANPSTLRVTDIEETQIKYLPGNPNQLRVTVIGDLKQRIREDEQGASTTNDLKIAETLNKQQIEDIAVGAGFLGSGGGGNPKLGALIAQHTITQKGKKIQIVRLKDLPDHVNIVSFGYMGSPAVAPEKLRSIKEGTEAIRVLERKLNKKFDALISPECAGSNATNLFAVAATLGLPVVDGDFMGRAFPGLNMVTPAIYGKFPKLVAVLSNPKGCKFITVRGDFLKMEDKARKETVKMGGSAALADLPMSGKEAKKLCIDGTLSIAREIGQAWRLAKANNKDRLKAINSVLAKTDYEGIECVFSGRIEDMRRVYDGGYSLGGVVIRSEDDRKALVGFQNENLIVSLLDQKGSHESTLAEVPDIIDIVDRNTFLPIPCEELKYGQDVLVIRMGVPKQMRTKEALKVVGPQAHPMEKILKLISQN